jgi:hypothetical protein
VTAKQGIGSTTHSIMQRHWCASIPPSRHRGIRKISQTTFFFGGLRAQYARPPYCSRCPQSRPTIDLISEQKPDSSQFSFSLAGRYALWVLRISIRLIVNDWRPLGQIPYSAGTPVRSRRPAKTSYFFFSSSITNSGTKVWSSKGGRT